MIVINLKASILNYAISGLFVKNSSDKTEDELAILSKYKEEQLSKKEVLISSKIMPIEEVPYQIPDNWKWVRLGTISKIVSKGTTPQGGKNTYKKSGVKFLRAENVKDYKIDEANIQFISEEVHNSFLKRSILEDNDLLICIAGTLGRCGIVSKENLPLNTNQAVAFVRLINNELTNVKYLSYAISSPIIQSLLVDQKKITAIPNLTLEIITNCMIPLPPVEEQNRIVEKIELLFSKLDETKIIEEELIKIKGSFSDNMKKSILKSAFSGEMIKVKPILMQFNECLDTVSTKSFQIKQKQIMKDGDYPVVSQSQEIIEGFFNDKTKLFKHEKPVLVYGDHSNNIKYIDFDFVVGADGTKVFTYNEKFNPKYLYYHILYNIYYIPSKGYSRHFKYLKELPISYFSMEIQNKIVNTIEKLLALCNDIEMLVNE